jgi:hypothetical protein
MGQKHSLDTSQLVNTAQFLEDLEPVIPKLGTKTMRQ